MDKTAKIDALIANQAKFIEILLDFNRSKSSDPTKHAILFKAHNMLKACQTSEQLDQHEHKVIDKYWDHYWEEMLKEMK